MLKMKLFCLMSVEVLVFGFMQGCDVPTECRDFMSLTSQQRYAVFKESTIEKQLDMYRCAMKGRPPDLGFAYKIADRGEEAVPLIIARLKQENDEVSQHDLIYALEIISDRGYLRDRKDVIEVIKEVIASMKIESIRESSKEMLKKIEMNT